MNSRRFIGCPRPGSPHITTVSRATTSARSGVGTPHPASPADRALLAAWAPNRERQSKCSTQRRRARSERNRDRGNRFAQTRPLHPLKNSALLRRDKLHFCSRPLELAMPKIFVSYRRKTTGDITGRIVDRLEAHYGKESIFIDIDNIPFGVDFRNRIEEVLQECDVMIAVVGRKWLWRTRVDLPNLRRENDWVRLEVESALNRNIRIIPILVDNAQMPVESDLPDGLKDFALLNAASVAGGRDFHTHVDRLIKSIDSKHDLPKQSSQLQQEPAALDDGTQSSTEEQTNAAASIEMSPPDDVPPPIPPAHDGAKVPAEEPTRINPPWTLFAWLFVIIATMAALAINDFGEHTPDRLIERSQVSGLSPQFQPPSPGADLVRFDILNASRLLADGTQSIHVWYSVPKGTPNPLFCVGDLLVNSNRVVFGRQLSENHSYFVVDAADKPVSFRLQCRVPGGNSLTQWAPLEKFFAKQVPGASAPQPGKTAPPFATSH
jgi:TIR domain